MDTSVYTPHSLRKQQQILYQQILRAEDPEQSVHAVLHHLREGLAEQVVSVVVFHLTSGLTTNLFFADEPEPAIPVGERLPLATAVFQDGLWRDTAVTLGWSEIKKLQPRSALLDKLARQGIESLTCLPLGLPSPAAGLLLVASRPAAPLTPKQRDFVWQWVPLLTLALQQMQMAPELPVSRLPAMTPPAGSKPDVARILDQVLHQLAQVVMYDSACLLFLENERALVVCHRGYERLGAEKVEKLNQVVLSTSSTATVRHIVATGQPFIIPDIHRFQGWVGEKAHVRSWAGVPVMVEEQVQAIICVESGKPDIYQPEHIERLIAFAGQVRPVLQNARLLIIMQRLQDEIEVLQRLATASAEIGDEDLLLAAATQIIGDILFPENFGILLLDQAKENLLTHHSYHLQDDKLRYPTIPVSQGIVGHVARSGKTYRSANTPEDPHYLMGSMQTRSELCVPLFCGDEIIGVINAEKYEPDAFTDADEHLLTTLARQLGIAIERMRLFAATQQQAEELVIISRILRDLNGTPDVTAVFPDVSANIKKLTRCTAVFLLELDASEGSAFHTITSDNPQAAANGRPSLLPEPIAADLQQGSLYLLPTVAGLPPQMPEQVLTAAGCQAGIYVPLRDGERLIGALVLGWDQPQGYAGMPLLHFQQIADAIVLAQLRGQLFNEMKQWAQKLTFLHELSRQMTGLASVQEICQTCAQQLSQNLNFPRVAIYQSDPEKQAVILVADHPPGLEKQPRWQFGQGLVGAVAQSGQPLILNDPQARAPEHDLAELVLPFRHGRRLIGVLTVGREAQNAFTDHDVAILTIAADQLAAAMERARLFEQTQLRAAKLEALSTLSTELRQAKTIESMLPAILQRAMSVVGGSLGSLYLKEAETGDMVCRGVHPPNPDLLGRRFQVGEGITGGIAVSGEIHITDNMAASKQARFYPQEEEMVNQKAIRSGIGLPLRAEERIVGVMYINLPHHHQFTEEEIEFLVAISEIAGGALERMMLLETLEDRVLERTHELADAYERLKELDRLKSRFISDVSHELRTPITNLNLYLELFSHADPAKYPHYLSVLRKQSDRLTRLITDILSLSRLEMGKDRVQFTPLNINVLVSSVVEAMTAQAETAGLEIVVTLAPELPEVDGEGNQLAQVVSHLLDNAIRYSLAGEIGVRTGVDEAAVWVYVAVSDSGPGLSEEDLPHLFDRFYRGRFASQSNIPGTGLGLAIVKEVVDIHGGRVEVDGREDGGSVFTVWLPACGTA